MTSGAPGETITRALADHDWRAALAAFDALENPAAADWLNRAQAQRMLHDLEGALASVDSALRLTPRDIGALLLKGALLERMARRTPASRVYKAALALISEEDSVSEADQALLRRARDAVRSYDEELLAALQKAAAGAGLSTDGAQDRFAEAMRIHAGLAKPFVQQPTRFYYPRLPAIGVYDHGLFPWLKDVEAHAEALVAEHASLRPPRLDPLSRAIVYAGSPTDEQKQTSAGAQDWAAVFLWRDGQPSDVLALVPETAAVLNAAPLLEQPGLAPTAYFQVLGPGARTPAGRGPSNARLMVHLPLSSAPEARLRVGNAAASFRSGEAVVFDDTIEHAFENPGPTALVTLAFDIWNPYLSERERDGVTAIMIAKARFETDR
jgi:aspartate beta-hydroxylase